MQDLRSSACKGGRGREIFGEEREEVCGTSIVDDASVIPGLFFRSRAMSHGRRRRGDGVGVGIFI